MRILICILSLTLIALGEDLSTLTVGFYKPSDNFLQSKFVERFLQRAASTGLVARYPVTSENEVRSFKLEIIQF